MWAPRKCSILLVGPRKVGPQRQVCVRFQIVDWRSGCMHSLPEESGSEICIQNVK